MKKYSILLLTILFALSSCQDELDFPEVGKRPAPEFWKSEEDAMAGLTACYGKFTSDWAFYDPSVLGPEQMAGDNTSSGGVAGGQSDFDVFKDFSITPSYARFNNLWKSRYALINVCNQVITNVPGIEMDEASKKQILGEARFIRAWAYFELVRLFGEVIIYDGIPADGVYDISKSSIEDVYAFILRDLDYGYNNMRKTHWDAKWKGRVTAWAARALEAKVLMYMASGANFMDNNQAIGGKTWADVEKVSDDVVKNGIYDLYTAKGNESFFYLFRLENENCIESIFESQNGASKSTGAVNASAYALNTWIKGQDGGFGYSVPSDNLVAAWKTRYENQNDLRYKYSIIFKGEMLVDNRLVEGVDALNGITGLPRYNYKVYVPVADRSGITGGGWMQQIEQNQRLLRFADILLIDAEAKLMSGNGDPLPSYNRVHTRAGQTAATSITIQDIWDERRFELAFENDRYFDLIRTGQAKTVLASKNWKYPKNIFYPIPQDQIDLSNGVLEQSSAWK